jgi:hypothetical protein
MAEGVRFIRRNGRIIPIRSSKSSSTEEKKPAPYRNLKLYVQGVGVSIGAQLSGKAFVKAQSPVSLEQLNQFKATHQSEWAKAGNPKLEQHPNFPAHSKAINRPLGLAPKGRFISMKIGNEAIFAHELGHLKAARQKGSANHLMRRIVAPMTRKKIGRFFMTKGMILQTARPFVDLVTEGEATGHAFKMAFKSGGLKKVARFSKTLLPAYATYALVAAGAGIQTFAQARAVTDYFKRKKK